MKLNKKKLTLNDRIGRKKKQNIYKKRGQEIST